LSNFVVFVARRSYRIKTRCKYLEGMIFKVVKNEDSRLEKVLLNEFRDFFF
jgi:hypothetical protein